MHPLRGDAEGCAGSFCSLSAESGEQCPSFVAASLFPFFLHSQAGGSLKGKDFCCCVLRMLGAGGGGGDGNESSV